MLARKLSEAGLPDARIVETESPCGDLPVELDGADLLVVVDAARPGKTTASGTWSRIDYRREPDRIVSRPSMIDVHGLGVDAALNLAREIGLLPDDVWVYAVAVEDCGYGEDLTPAVCRTLDELTVQIPADIAAWRECRGPGRA